MKPAEIVTVVVSIPMIAALLAAEVAESRTPATAPVVRTAQAEMPAPTFFDEIVVTAKRTANRG